MYRTAVIFLCMIAFIPVPVSLALAADEPYGYSRNDVRLEMLLDSEVQSATGRSMGKLRDVIIDTEGSIEAAVVEFEEGIGNSGVAIAILEWSDIVADPQQGAVVASIGSDNQEQRAFDVDGMHGQDINGRRAVLDDDADAGRVVDLLVASGDARVTALLVEMDGEVYALPFDIARVEAGRDFVSFATTREEVAARGEYQVATVKSAAN